VAQIQQELGQVAGGLFHLYNIREDEKVFRLKKVLKDWKLA